MSRTAIITLCIILLVAAVANSYVVNVYGRDGELYPMTAWQMFSGRPYRVARQFVFDIVPSAGTDPIEVEGKRMFIAGTEIVSVNTRRIMTGIMKSASYYCDGYRLKNFRDCKHNPVKPWIIPKDIADTWVKCAMHELGLSQPPYSITPVMIEYPLSENFQVMLNSGERTPFFIWYPGSGGYAVEGQAE